MPETATEKTRRRYNRIAPIYDIMDRAISDSLRAKALRQTRGKVLEVGVGTGKNLPLYPEGIQLTGIDLSPEMLKRAKLKAERLGLSVDLQLMDAENLQFPADTFDTVVATCVFCSVPDPVRGLEEIRRVVKPDGQVILLEHVRSANPALGFLMDLLNPLARLVGPNINRRTVENVRRAGLSITEVKDVKGHIFKLVHAQP